MGSRWEDGHIELFFDVEQVADFFGEHAPLVVAEVIDNDEEHFLPVVKQGEDMLLENVGRHGDVT